MNLKFENVGETNIIFESNLGCESGDHRGAFDGEKQRGRKSYASVPLKQVVHP
jgi:hypothetical protein